MKCSQRVPSNIEGTGKINVEMRVLRWLLGRGLNWSFKEWVECTKMKISIRSFKTELYILNSSRNEKALEPHLVLFYFVFVPFFLTKAGGLPLDERKMQDFFPQSNIRCNILFDRNNRLGHTPVAMQSYCFCGTSIIY